MCLYTKHSNIALCLHGFPLEISFCLRNFSKRNQIKFRDHDFSENVGVVFENKKKKIK